MPPSSRLPRAILPKRSRRQPALGIATAYGSYEELLADPSIDAIYNPLPNHLHVPWTIQAAEAGKHVLCEKPISLTVAEAETLLAVRARTGVKIGEAFMVDCHPQWIRLRSCSTRAASASFAPSPASSATSTSTRQHPQPGGHGGGALMDIGCYMIHASRYGFRQEPARVVGLVDRDPRMKTDRLTSAILDFPNGQSIFTCSTQLAPYQRIHFLGTKGRIELEIPVNSPPDRPTRLFIDSGSDLFGGGITTETFPVCDQYTLQGDAFSKAIQEDTEIPVPLEDAIRNMAVIDAVFRSAGTGRWETPHHG